MSVHNDKGASRGASPYRWPVLLLLLGVFALEGCAKPRRAPVTAVSTTTTTTTASPSLFRPADGVVTRGAPDDMAADAEDEGDEAGGTVYPGAVGPGDAPGTRHAAAGLSGDTLNGRIPGDAVVAGSVESVLAAMAAPSDMKVFFSTNAVDRGLGARRVDLGKVSSADRAGAIDAACRQADLSCFYAADLNSLSVYDPKELQESGPDMTALVYNRRNGFEVATAATEAAARPPVRPAQGTPAKPSHGKPAKPGKPVAGKPGKPSAGKPSKPGKPAASKPSSGKPGAAKPGAAKPAAGKPPAAASKPAKPKPASAPVPSRKPSKPKAGSKPVQTTD
ncbi:hypothetical protein [Zavarzinia sp.]|uniref:hypothetical protein n=1 Tax=Zavarzinia sp. TaxID=2027920 RepID=UPI0035681897